MEARTKKKAGESNRKAAVVIPKWAALPSIDELERLSVPGGPVVQRPLFPELRSEKQAGGMVPPAKP